MDSILGMYRLYLQQSKAQETRYQELKSEFEGQNPKKIVKDIRDFVDNYNRIENSGSKEIFILENLSHTLYWKTILIAAKKDSVDYFDDLRDELIGFYYSYWIGDYTSEKIKIPSIKVLTLLRDEASLEEIQEYIGSKRKRDNIPERVRDGLYSDNVYGDEKWHKSLLIAIEYGLSDSQKVERIKKRGGGMHIEHVLPKSYGSAMEKYDYWEDNFSREEANQLRNTLGNLVPLQYDLNAKAAQKPFGEKAAIYQGEWGKPRSSFDLALRVARGDYGDWSPEAIEAHRDYLIERSAELLNLPVDSILIEEDSEGSE